MFQEYNPEVYDEEDQAEYADSFIESRILVDDTTTPKTTVQPVAMLTKPKPSKKREIDDTLEASDEYFETMKKQMLMTSFTGTPEDFGITPKVVKPLVKKPRIGNFQF